MAYMGRLRPQGVFTTGLKYVGVEISQVEVYKRVEKTAIKFISYGPLIKIFQTGVPYCCLI